MLLASQGPGLRRLGGESIGRLSSWRGWCIEFFLVLFIVFFVVFFWGGRELLILLTFDFIHPIDGIMECWWSDGDTNLKGVVWRPHLALAEKSGSGHSRWGHLCQRHPQGKRLTSRVAVSLSAGLSHVAARGAVPGLVLLFVSFTLANTPHHSIHSSAFTVQIILANTSHMVCYFHVSFPLLK